MQDSKATVRKGSVVFPCSTYNELSCHTARGTLYVDEVVLKALLSPS